MYLQDVPRGTPARTVYVNLHKSTGLTIGLFILLRLYWRLTHKAPPLPVTLPAWERAARPLAPSPRPVVVRRPTQSWIAAPCQRGALEAARHVAPGARAAGELRACSRAGAPG
ncbi:MAG TPA: hypothetical protein VHI32_01835 [Burkholderiales bacterium]|nr:hypothetical protein [Burkholderiales bacterium]